MVGIQYPLFLEQRGLQHRRQDQGVLAARPDLRGEDPEAGQQTGHTDLAKILRSLPGLEF